MDITPQQPKTVRLALYGRVSTEEQKEGQTIDSQINELRKFADEQKWSIVEIYEDDGWSGGILNRPELDRLRDDAAQGKFEAVLINDVDRLARDVTHLGVIKRDLEKRGVRVIFRKLPSEEGPMRNLMINVLGSYAEFEREMIADRTRRGTRHKVEVRKLYLGAIPSYGFTYTKKNRETLQEGYLELHPTESSVVRSMYQWIDYEGLSARKVVQRLNELGVPPRKRGTRWQKSSVTRILRNEMYAGTWYYNKHQSCEPERRRTTKRHHKPKTSRRRRGRAEWIPVKLSDDVQIVSREQWQRVQERLTKNRAFSPRNSKHNYLLRGLVRCGACNAAYVGEPGHGKFFYRCSKRCRKLPTIREATLNATVWETIESIIKNPDCIAREVPWMESRIGARSDQKQNLKTAVRLEKLKSEESTAWEQYRKDELSPQQLASELERLKSLRSAGQLSAGRDDSPAEDVSNLGRVKRTVEEYCALLAQRLDAMGPERRQFLVQLFVRQVVFEGTLVRIIGRVPLDRPLSEIPSGVGTLQTGEPIATTKGC